MFDLTKILRPHIAKLKPYSSARDEYKSKEGVFLDANENPLNLGRTIAYNRYPDPYQVEVKERLAEIKNCKSNQIFLGNGSDEAIDLLMRAICQPKIDNIIIMPPTYPMYEVSAELNEVAIKKVPLRADYHLDSPKVIEAIDEYTKLILVCSPNNPTGNSMKRDDIVAIIENFSEGIVVIDEAYQDFSGKESFIDRLSMYPNIVVLQTFSKAWGLAGLRLGMAFASPEIIAVLSKIKSPYNVSSPAQKSALEAMQNPNFLSQSVEILTKNREKLVAELKKISVVVEVFPSDTNFILVKFKDAKAIFSYLIDKKIILRDRSSVPFLENCCRISIGTSEENDQLIDALRAF